jgi:hypothetical protein
MLGSQPQPFVPSLNVKTNYDKACSPRVMTVGSSLTAALQAREGACHNAIELAAAMVRVMAQVYVSQAQQAVSQQSIASETVQLRASMAGLDPVLLPVRLRPGAPSSLRLMSGHPFSEQVCFSYASASWLLRGILLSLQKCPNVIPPPSMPCKEPPYAYHIFY